MDPITREEKLMAGEQLEPITRKEYFLAKAAGMDVETPEPITREEMFLSMISGGGTGGSILDENGKLLNSVLPYGYPYAEYEFKPITWDGNTEGLVSAGNLYKVSELPENLPADYDFTDANNSPIVFDGVTYRNNSYQPIQNGAGVINVKPDNRSTDGVAFALEANSQLVGNGTVPFPEPGIYFYKSDNGKFVSWFAGAESIIRKLDTAFIPEVPTYWFGEEDGELWSYGIDTESALYNICAAFYDGKIKIKYDMDNDDGWKVMSCVSASEEEDDDGNTLFVLLFVNHDHQIKLTLTGTYDEDYNYTGFTIEKEVLNTGGASKTLNLYACYRDMADDGTAERTPALTPGNILDWGGTSYDDYVSAIDLLNAENVIVFEGQTEVGVHANVNYHSDGYVYLAFYSEHDNAIRIMCSKEYGS